MKSIFTYSFLLLFAKFGIAHQDFRIKEGNWSAKLLLNEKDELPFKLIIQKVKSKYQFIICNASEKITLTDLEKKGDSLIVSFPTFNSKLFFKIHTKKELKGYWLNYNKSNNYKIPFSAYFNYETRFSNQTNDTQTSIINGKWKVIFDPNTNDAYPSIGLFSQNNQSISGTFLTETGDYRYLEGNQFGNQLFLSCFDGSHAFLFVAELKNDSLKGRFLSGKHFEGLWEATKNDSFQLNDPYSITKIQTTEPFHFQLKDINGKDFSFPNQQFENKVVIIQIMGTWCPNCMDETRYYKELYEKYHSKGLEIISIGYEVGATFEDYAKKIALLKERLNLNFTFLVGGNASKSLASEQFSMLNEVISFPTSIFLNKDGIVKRVHTGFNGPGTGEYYTEYVEKTNLLIEAMLMEK
ncbi:MAG: TlpA family protein disulfide reductase [Flavobacteriia bacterium]|nr:TlpA family protein disulfide reductase [Flavobacteriia bacterium]